MNRDHNTLAQVVADLEAEAGEVTSGNGWAGYWKRIAAALETLAGASTTTSDTLLGYMLRAAVAAEALGGTSGTDETSSQQGYLKRIVDALEAANGQVNTGSLLERLRLAADSYTGAPPTEVPANATPPELNETTYVVGDSPTWTQGTWTNPPILSRTHNLYADGVLIGGGPYTSGSYQLQAAEAQAAITVREVAANVVGNSLAAESDPVIVTVVLSALTLNDPSIPQDEAAEIIISGATTGSTITVSDGALPTGMILNSGDRTITGTPTVGGATEFTLRETLAAGSNSPRDTLLALNIEAHTIFNTNGDSTLLGVDVVGFVDFATEIDDLANALDAGGPYNFSTQTLNEILVDLDDRITILEGGSSEVQPSTFFTADARGVAWDLADLDTLFQDIAGTTPVTTAGQSVGKVLDVSGKGNHWVAAADNTTRPTYQVDADGKPYLSFDGTNDVMYAATAFAGGTTKAEAQTNAIVGMLAATPGTSRRGLQAGGTGTNPAISMLHCATDGSVTMAMLNDTGNSHSTMAALAGALDGATKRIVNAQYHGNNETQRIRDAVGRPSGGGDGNYTELAETSLTQTFTTTRSSLGASTTTTPASFYAGRIYSGIVINRATTGMLTEAELRDAEDWVNARTRTSDLP